MVAKTRSFHILEIHRHTICCWFSRVQVWQSVVRTFVEDNCATHYAMLCVAGVHTSRRMPPLSVAFLGLASMIVCTDGGVWPTLFPISLMCNRWQGGRLIDRFMGVGLGSIRQSLGLVLARLRNASRVVLRIAGSDLYTHVVYVLLEQRRPLRRQRPFGQYLLVVLRFSAYGVHEHIGKASLPGDVPDLFPRC